MLCPTKVRLALVNADLVPQVINTLNPQSLSFAETVDIHVNLMKTIHHSLSLTTSYGLAEFTIEDENEQQAVHEAVLKKVLLPSEKYIWHLCVNRCSIIDGELCNEFMHLLAELLQISPYFQPTMDFVLNMHVFLTIPSCLTFVEDEESIVDFDLGVDGWSFDWQGRIGVGMNEPTPSTFIQRCHSILNETPFECIILVVLEHLKMLPSPSLSSSKTHQHVPIHGRFRSLLRLHPPSHSPLPLPHYPHPLTPLCLSLTTHTLPLLTLLQPVLDASLEAKAVKFLYFVTPESTRSAHAFLGSLASPSDHSLTNFIQCIVVLFSSASKRIITATMEILENLFSYGSAEVQYTLVQADLIPQLISTFNPQSITFAETVEIHIYLLKIIWFSLWVSTQDGFTQLGIEDDDEQQAIHETVLKQVLVPSEKYICHLCANRYSIVNGEQSRDFVTFLARLLRICPSYQRTVDFVLHMASRSIFATLSITSTFALSHCSSVEGSALFDVHHNLLRRHSRTAQSIPHRPSLSTLRNDTADSFVRVEKCCSTSHTAALGAVRFCPISECSVDCSEDVGCMKKDDKKGDGWNQTRKNDDGPASDMDVRERREKSEKKRANAEKRHNSPRAHLSACVCRSRRSSVSLLVAFIDRTATNDRLSTPSSPKPTPTDSKEGRDCCWLTWGNATSELGRVQTDGQNTDAVNLAATDWGRLERPEPLAPRTPLSPAPLPRFSRFQHHSLALLI
ncbi:hypothetical protein BLNAU_12116 [Blattamonas nauphoetae]|uniref:Uncharacterized protein n=1 Tax=Blattamonas nauphoetae TaxID=2049346 RepID=A0ABQ9XN62_9EUKA|nr:hypothetical protein BLNAU_12116 [Blattamonas nauphoetae]